MKKTKKNMERKTSVKYTRDSLFGASSVNGDYSCDCKSGVDGSGGDLKKSSDSVFTTKNIVIGIATIVAIVGLLKWQKVI